MVVGGIAIIVTSSRLQVTLRIEIGVELELSLPESDLEPSLLISHSSFLLLETRKLKCQTVWLLDNWDRQMNRELLLRLKCTTSKEFTIYISLWSQCDSTGWQLSNKLLFIFLFTEASQIQFTGNYKIEKPWSSKRHSMESDDGW